MKLKWKIYLICMSIYIATLTVSGIIVTENTYSSQINKEIYRALQEENNIHDSAELYLVANQKTSEDKIDIRDYSKRLVDMFTNENVSLELYDTQSKLLETNINKQWSFKRDDLEKLTKEGRNYVLRKEGNTSYLFINDTIKADSNELLMSYIKDISEIKAQRKEQYLLFLKVGAVGLILIGIIIEFLIRILLRPIKSLGKAAEKIASGSFSERAAVKGEDEISKLGVQFNIMAAEVEKRIGELQEEGDRKQRFIDNLAHELRTPLTSVIGYSELLQKMKYDEGAFNKGLSYIHSEGMRMLRLANSLMEMILLRQGSLNIERVNIYSLLQEAADLIQARTKDKKLQISIKGEELELNIDKDMIKGVMLNLIDNAIKASGEGKKIIIGCEKNGQYCSVFVEDEGRGIAQEEIPKIVEPFYRIDKSRARKDGGAGLGLALCKQIVENHNGQLKIESELGKGTRVSIVLEAVGKGEVEIA